MTTILLFGLTNFVLAGPIKQMPPIVVIGYKSKIANSLNTAIITRKTIEKSNSFNLLDLLKNVPGININENSIAQSPTTEEISINGLSGRDHNIVFAINGMPILTGGPGMPWSSLSAVPLSDVERIEIIKGASSIEYGNVLGGVINVITKKPTKKPYIGASVSYGTSDDIDYIKKYAFTNSYKVGPLGYVLNIGYKKASPFLWNNYYKSKNSGLSLYFDMPYEGKLTLGLLYADEKQGLAMDNRKSQNPNSPLFYQKINPDYPLSVGDRIMPPIKGPASKVGPNAYRGMRNTFLSLDYRQPILNGLLKFSIYKNHINRKDKNYFSNGKLALDRTLKLSRSYGGSLQYIKSFDVHELLIGTDYNVDKNGSASINHIARGSYAMIGPSFKITPFGLYVQDKWQIGSDFTLIPALRYDSYRAKSNKTPSFHDDAVEPKLSAIWNATKKDELTLSIYRAVRTPKFNEIMRWYNGFVHGQNTLKPVKCNAIEFACRHSFTPKDYVQFSTHYYDLRDYIAWARWSCYNVDKAIVKGASLYGTAELIDGFSAYGYISWQQSKKYGDPYNDFDELNYFPEYQANLGAKLSLPYKATFDAKLRYVSNQKTTYQYTEHKKSHSTLARIPSYTTIDANLSIPVTKYGSIKLYANNIFNKHYEEKFGYPMPGRIIGASMQIKF